jgi:hypothetical protein
MTITSVVLGDGTPEDGWVCASTDAAGITDISKGKSSFMIYLDSVCLSQAGCLPASVLLFARDAQHVTGLRMIGFFMEPVTNRRPPAKSQIVSEGDEQLRALMIRYQGGSLEAFQEIYAQVAPGVRR